MKLPNSSAIKYLFDDNLLLLFFNHADDALGLTFFSVRYKSLKSKKMFLRSLHLQ